MFKKIFIYSLCSTPTIFGCPMGLGKNYQDKPPFFHPTFYTHQKQIQKKWLPMSCKNNKTDQTKLGETS